MKVCKLCKAELSDLDVWKHLITKHPKQIMKEIKTKPIKCLSCRKIFTPSIELHETGNITAPVFCQTCLHEKPFRKIVRDIVVMGDSR